MHVRALPEAENFRQKRKEKLAWMLLQKLFKRFWLSR